MKKKNIALVLMLSLALVVLYGCAANQTPDATATPPLAAATATTSLAAASPAAASPAVQGTAAGELELTIEELAAYDGKNGQPAYIAVDGVIYDVSKDSNWRNGKHEGYSAGKDLTKEIKESSHGTSVLNRVPIVGKIKQ